MARSSFEIRSAEVEATPPGLPTSWRWYGAPLEVAALTWPATAELGSRALLLDRDGTMIIDTGFLSDPNQVQLVPEAVDTMHLARERGWLLGMISNQGGIGLELFGWAELAAVQGAVDAALAEQALALDVALVCPYHPNGTHPRFGRSQPIPLGRKPGPGMVRLAIELLGLGSRAEVLLVGDKKSDVAAAAAAGQEATQVATCSTSSAGLRSNPRDRAQGWERVRRRLGNEGVRD
jgi:histidinol-phosphate phosphatase family protein